MRGGGGGGVPWCSEVWVGESTPQGPLAMVIVYLVKSCDASLLACVYSTFSVVIDELMICSHISGSVWCLLLCVEFV